MTIVRDLTDPMSTRHPNKNLILVFICVSKFIVVTERSSKIYLSLNIGPNNIYSIFSLFFINNVLVILAKNTKKYIALREVSLL